MKRGGSYTVALAQQNIYCCYECWTDITPTSHWRNHKLVALITVG